MYASEQKRSATKGEAARLNFGGRAAIALNPCFRRGRHVNNVQARLKLETVDYQVTVSRLRPATLDATNDGDNQFLQLAQL